MESGLGLKINTGALIVLRHALGTHARSSASKQLARTCIYFEAHVNQLDVFFYLKQKKIVKCLLGYVFAGRIL